MSGDEYLTLNRAAWDERAPAHAASPGYAVDRFLADPAHLSDVVRFDLPQLGDVDGLDAVHLQCHIGTDTLSLARLGARMTGLDFSAASLQEARRLAKGTGTAIDYVESDVYLAVEALGRARFDLVYTGVGALNWLPSVDRWATVVAGLLRPGGRLFIREGHPMLSTLEDERQDDLLVVRYPYFEVTEPMVWDEPGTYVETDVEFQHTRTHEWSHGIGQVVTAVLQAGLQVTALAEHDSVPWEAVPGLMAPHPDHPGELRLAERPERLAASYTLQAVKPA